jgi:hypothetical protein
MKITQYRLFQDSGATISIRFLDGVKECFVLEDAHQSVKIPGKTRIPAGVYRLGLRKVGKLHEQYAKKFSKFHIGMIEILNVPNFTAILDHIGNSTKDTDGCNLLGLQADLQSMTIAKSAIAYENYYRKVAPLLAKGVAVTLEIIDEGHLRRTL